MKGLTRFVVYLCLPDMGDVTAATVFDVVVLVAGNAPPI